ncbi:MAG: DUF1573 domain-containing protein [Bacteroidales bacterium]|nr:DUF1573 domain-containing protein [Bacteroidales bacterium]
MKANKKSIFTIHLLILCILQVLISQHTPVYAQNSFSGVIEFDKSVHDFGDFMISDGKKTCTFTYKNISDSPLVIHDIITSCGCTDPVWSKQPVHPGKQGTIQVTFNNDLGPYPFDKALTVYVSNVHKPVILRIRGNVLDRKRSLEELFPIRIGSLGLREAPLNLGQIEQGVSRSETIEVANLSDRPIQVSFTHNTPGLYLQLDHPTIPAKGKTQLRYSIDTEKTREKLWGKNTFEATVQINGKAQQKPIQVIALIKENFAGYTEQQRRSGALPQFQNSSADFKRIKSTDSATVSYTCKNAGKVPLVIYKIDGSDPGLEMEFPKEIAPGSSGTIRVKVTPEALAQQKNEEEILFILTVITNSPVRPLTSLFITGVVED